MSPVWESLCISRLLAGVQRGGRRATLGFLHPKSLVCLDHQRDLISQEWRQAKVAPGSPQMRLPGEGRPFSACWRMLGVLLSLPLPYCISASPSHARMH